MGSVVTHAGAQMPHNPSINGVYNINTQTYHPLQNQMASTYTSTLAAQQAQHAALLRQQYAQQFTPKKYMIDGVAMDFQQFVDTIYPDDCAEKTMLILKFKKED